jgi:hypothetical protein
MIGGHKFSFFFEGTFVAIEEVLPPTAQMMSCYGVA